MNAEYAFSYYTAKGVPANVAAGIVGNLVVESNNFSPNVIAGTKRGDNGTAYYVGQWRGNRKTNLENFARATGRKATDLDAQLDFVLEEMNPKSQYRDVIAAKNRDKIMSATTADEAARAFSKHYERPGTPHLSRREAAATRLASLTPVMAPPAKSTLPSTLTAPAFATAVPARSVTSTIPGLTIPDEAAIPAMRPDYAGPLDRPDNRDFAGPALAPQVASANPFSIAAQAAPMPAPAALAPTRSPAEQNVIDQYSYAGLTRSRAPANPVGSVPGAPPTSPAMGARAASGLQGYVAPAPALAPARTVADMPVASAAVPSSLATIMAPPSTMTRPAMNTAVPAQPVSTSAVPLSSIGSFPEAPMSPGRRAAGEIAKGAAMGALSGGLPGAVLGGLLGPAKAQIGRNIAHNRAHPDNRIGLFDQVRAQYRGLNPFGRLGSFGGLGGMFSGIPAPNFSASPFSVGSGYGGIAAAFGGPAGATAFSRSNPEVSFTSLGNGYVQRSNSEYGTTSIMGPGDYDPGTGGNSGGKGKGK